MRNFIVFILLLVLTGALVNAQKRTKLPRITLEAPVKKQDKNVYSNPVIKESKYSLISPVTSHFQEEMVEADQSTVAEVSILQQQADVTETAHSGNMVVTKPKMHSMNAEEKLPFTFSGSILTSHTPLFKVKEAEKTAMELWVILLIIFYVLGFIFTIICLLAILLWNNFTLFIVFLILAVLFSAAGSLMLTLGQMGVM